jgi:hypothetical protein
MLTTREDGPDAESLMDGEHVFATITKIHPNWWINDGTGYGDGPFRCRADAVEEVRRRYLRRAT